MDGKRGNVATVCPYLRDSASMLKPVMFAVARWAIKKLAKKTASRKPAGRGDRARHSREPWRRFVPAHLGESIFGPRVHLAAGFACWCALDRQKTWFFACTELLLP